MVDRERVAFDCGGGGGSGDRFIKSGRRKRGSGRGCGEAKDRGKREGRKEGQRQKSTGKKLMDQESSRRELLVASDAKRNRD